MRLIESYEVGERVRIEPGRWRDGHADGKRAELAGAEGRIVRLGGHSAVRLPNGTEEDLYVVELDHGGRTCVGTGSLVSLREEKPLGQSGQR